MANKKCHITFFRLHALFFMLTGAAYFVSAQTSPQETSDFYVERRFIQRLSWSGNEYASRYEVIIEKEEEGGFRQVRQDFTTAFSIEVSLSPGRYHYCVIPYDFFGRRGSRTEWVDFEIFAAVLPKLFFSVPELYLSGDERPVFSGEYVLMVYGMDISPHAVIMMRMENGTIIFPVNTRIFPDRSSARLVFEDLHAIPRSFDIVVKNPGDLEASMRTRSYISTPPDKNEARQIFDELGIMPESLYSFFGIIAVKDETDAEEIEKREPLPLKKFADWYLAAGFSPLFSTFDYIALMPEAVTSVTAASLQIGFIRTPENGFFWVGLEAALSLFTFNVTTPNHQSQNSEVNAVSIDANLIFQKLSFNEMTAFKFRFGLGITALSGDANIQNILVSDPFHLNIGTAFTWYALKHLYLETGIDMIYWILDEDSSGAIRPSVCIGIKF